jgi:serine/threonine protein kinase
MHEQVAIKIMDKAVIDSQNYESNVRREIKVLNLLSHPAVVRYVGSFDTKQSVYIVMEYLQNGDLQQVCVIRVRHCS